MRANWKDPQEIAFRYRRRIERTSLAFYPDSKYTKGKIEALDAVAKLLGVPDGPNREGRLAALKEFVGLVEFSEEEHA